VLALSWLSNSNSPLILMAKPLTKSSTAQW
jgi:hypothetical protein